MCIKYSKLRAILYPEPNSKHETKELCHGQSPRFALLQRHIAAKSSQVGHCIVGKYHYISQEWLCDYVYVWLIGLDLCLASHWESADARDTCSWPGSEASEGSESNPQGVSPLRRDAHRCHEQAVHLLPWLEQAETSLQSRILRQTMQETTSRIAKPSLAIGTIAPLIADAAAD